jgi:tRNA-dihydrouridine synthase
LEFSPEERPIVAQLFTGNIESMEAGARLVAELGFDGFDINMGCPDRSIEKQCAGAALIKDPLRAQSLIVAAQRGAGSLPISVKTRIGYNKNEVETWIPTILQTKPAALTIHARTRKEMSLVPAHWEDVARVVQLRDAISPKTLIIGNGDIKSLEEGRQRVAETGCDGIMIGRGAFGSPWLFSEREATPQERIDGLREHIQLFDELMIGTQSFAVMKKHFKAYITSWRGAKELREELMATNTPEEACYILTRAKIRLGSFRRR